MAFVLCCAPLPATAAYPETRRVDHVDVYHGVKVSDPYRWLEADVRTSPEVAAWVAAENKVTAAYLAAIPQREAIRRRLTELWNFAQYSAPRKEAGRYYYQKNDGLQNQAVLYVMDSLDGKPRALLNPNEWSADGTVALAGLGFSDDGKHFAYGRSEAGSDWSTWRVMEIATGRDLPDELKWIKFSQASWSKDGQGFFYSHFPAPSPGAEFQAANSDNKLYYHRLGTPQSADVLVYWRPDHPDWLCGGHVSEDGRWLVISLSKGDRNRVLVRDLAEPYAMPVELVGNFEHQYAFVGNDGPVLFFTTDADAPRRRLVAIDVSGDCPNFRRAAGENGTVPFKPACWDGSCTAIPCSLQVSGTATAAPTHGNTTSKSKLLPWRDIIPQADATLQHVSLVGDQFLASYIQGRRHPSKSLLPRRPTDSRRKPAGHRHSGRL